MKRTHLITTLLICSALIAVLHKLALDFSWYWTYRWLDVPMHLLGGAITGLFTFLLYRVLFPQRSRTAKNRKILLVLILGTLIVGTGWEMLEQIYNLTLDAGYSIDTAKDLFVDVAGALVAGIFVIAFREKSLSDQSL